jgi:hypothetical protein
MKEEAEVYFIDVINTQIFRFDRYFRVKRETFLSCIFKFKKILDKIELNLRFQLYAKICRVSLVFVYGDHL